MELTQTESTNMKFFIMQEWEFRMPLNYSVIDIAAPEGFAEIKNSEISNLIPSDLTFAWESSENTIDPLIHKALLDESIREYSNIWRTLAGK